MPLNMNDGGGRIKGVLAASVTLAVAVAVAQPDPLAERFANPPAECALQAWWHWVSDCVTEEGIDRDLAAMAEMGRVTGTVPKYGVIFARKRRYSSR